MDAARAVFAEQGADAPVTEIVRRAGFAKGTFFRHFATKEALVQALLTDRLTKLEELAREINTTFDPGWESLSLMMKRILALLEDDRSLGEFLERGDITPTPAMRRGRRAFGDEVETAVRGAQATGEVRPDVTTSDLLSIVFMLSRTTSRHRRPERKLRRHHLQLFLDGIRVTNPAALAEPTPQLEPLDAHQPR